MSWALPSTPTLRGSSAWLTPFSRLVGARISNAVGTRRGFYAGPPSATCTGTSTRTQAHPTRTDPLHVQRPSRLPSSPSLSRKREPTCPPPTQAHDHDRGLHPIDRPLFVRDGTRRLQHQAHPGHENSPRRRRPHHQNPPRRLRRSAHPQSNAPHHFARVPADHQKIRQP